MPRSKTQDSLAKNLAKTTQPRKRKKVKEEPIKFTKRKDPKLFPHYSFTWRLENRVENKTCWFQCFDHAEKYITRYSLQPKDYKLMEKT